MAGSGARVTPYELAVPGRAFAEERFAAVAREAESRGVDPTDPPSFVNLGEVGRILQEVRGEDEDPELIHQHGLLFYHAFRFWRSGEPFYVLETGAARFLVETEPDPPAGGAERRGGSERTTEPGMADDAEGATGPGSVAEPPSEAGYLQLPRHLFWSRPDPEGEAPAEPVDGFFWSTTPEGRLWTLVVLGIRGDRPGLSVFPLPDVPLADASEWLRVRVRDEGDDFETTLPGGEIDRLYSVETAGEVLKLLARVFWYLKAFPEAVEGPVRPQDGAEAATGEGEGADADDEGGVKADVQGGVPSSRLPYHRIGLSGTNEGGT